MKHSSKNSLKIITSVILHNKTLRPFYNLVFISYKLEQFNEQLSHEWLSTDHEAGLRRSTCARVHIPRWLHALCSPACPRTASHSCPSSTRTPGPGVAGSWESAAATGSSPPLPSSLLSPHSLSLLSPPMRSFHSSAGCATITPLLFHVLAQADEARLIS